MIWFCGPVEIYKVDWPETIFPLAVRVRVAEVFQMKRPVVVGDVHQYPYKELWLESEEVRAWLGSPLLIQQQVIGVLALDNFTVDAYHDEDAQIMQAFANQAAIAIRNAQLYTEAQREIAERRETEKALGQSP